MFSSLYAFSHALRVVYMLFSSSLIWRYNISFDKLSRNYYNYIYGLMVKFGLPVFYLFGLPVKNLAFQFSIYSAFLSKIWPSGFLFIWPSSFLFIQPSGFGFVWKVWYLNATASVDKLSLPKSEHFLKNFGHTA